LLSRWGGQIHAAAAAMTGEYDGSERSDRETKSATRCGFEVDSNQNFARA
jgi:hypothetical protein